MNYLQKVILGFLVFTIFSFLNPLSASTATGLEWLTAQVSSDNNYSSNTYTATQLQSLSEMETTIHLYGGEVPVAVEGQITNDDYNSTEHLSRKITMNLHTNGDITALSNEILKHQNFDGSFGELPGYDGSVIDTAYALKALSSTQVNTNVISYAISFLLSKQTSDGGWHDGVNISDVELSALIMNALWGVRKQFDVQASLDAATSFLLSKKNINGLWESNHQSALVLIAIAPTLSTNTTLLTPVDALEQAQQSDQSWESDIYTTALVLQALKIASNPLPNPDLATISGKVVDGDNGIELSNVTVTLNNGDKTVSTDVDGLFAFTSLKEGDYALSIVSDNHTPLNIALRLAGGDIDLGTIRLNKTSGTTISSLRGSVKHALKGDLLNGVTVSIGDREVVTDSDGIYVVDSIAAGNYTFTLSKAGFVQSQTTVYIPENKTLYYNTQLTPIDFAVEASIHGAIIDSDSALPMEGAVVELNGADSSLLTTLNDGEFLFNTLGQGVYTITITKDGYRTQLISITINQSNAVNLDSIVMEKIDANASMVKLSGIITQTDTKLPLESALVTVGSATAYTDSSGYYELTDLTTGVLTIEISKAGYESISTQVEVTAGLVVRYSPMLNKIDADASIYGTIFSSDSSQPLSYVKVSYNGETNSSVFTDSEGFYRIDQLNEGVVSLQYSKEGYETIAFNINVNTSTNVSPTLTPITINTPDNNATLEGVVVDLISNVPMEDVIVQVKGLGTDSEIISDVNGLIHLSDITSYDLNLSFHKDGYKDVNTLVHLNENEFFNMGPVSMRPLSDRELLADLTVLDSDLSNLNITQSALSLTGSMEITVVNQGGVPTNTAFVAIAFYDQNRDGLYTQQTDLLLGQASTNDIIGVDENTTLSFTISGSMPYVNAPVSVWIDSKTNIIENNETNNIVAFNKQCGVVSTIVQKTHQSIVVKEAIVKGSDYIAPQTMSWDRSNRCLGCHVQTQTLVGLQASKAKASVDTVTGEYLLAKLLDSQQSDGSIRRSHPGYSKTQTSFALWSLSYVPDTNRTFDVRANALRYMYSRKQTSGNQTYWTQDHNTGWLRSPEAVSSVVVLGASRYLKDAEKQANLTPLQQDIVAKYQALLPTMARYLLNRATVNHDTIKTSLILVGLGELKRHLVDPSLVQEVGNTIDQLDLSLRDKQNSDGGWSYTSWKGSSDPLTSAWVGFALNYQSPLQSDQAVLNNIQFLLDSQRSNGTWVTNSGLFSTHLATTSLVMAYLPVALDFLDSADLSVSLMQLTEQTNGTLSLSARIANGGSDRLRIPTSISFYDGDPEQNGTLIAEESILMLEKWDYFDAQIDSLTTLTNNNIYAVVDERNWINECNELNNYMNIPAVASKFYATITASTNKTTYGAFEDVELSASVVNLGRLSGEFSAELEVIDEAGISVQSFNREDLGLFASGETKKAHATWNTSAILSGNYQLKATLIDRDGNTISTSFTDFAIDVTSPDVTSVTLNVTTDKPVYHTSDQVVITNLIENRSVNSLIDFTSLYLEVKDVNGTAVYTENIVVGTLTPDAVMRRINTFTFNKVKEGQYTVVATLQDLLGATLASASTTYNVVEDTRLALQADITAQLSSLDRGETQICTASILNSGTKDINVLPTRGILVYADTQTEVTSQSDTVTLVTGDSMEITYTIPTAGMDVGEYFCIFQAELNGVWETMAHDAYILTEPPIQINTQIDVGTKTPLLVLVDSPQERGWCLDMFSAGYEGHDPYGPYDAPMLTEQRAYLENLLDTHGYSYKIVDNASDFQQELRSGNYATYALFNEYIKLSSQTLSEIREAVYRGDGLLFAGKHQYCNDELQTPLGLDFKVTHDHVTSMTVSNTNEYTGGNYVLLYEDKATRFKLDGAEQLGSFEIDSGFFDFCPDDEKYSLTRHQYKNGRGVFAAFDLLMQASDTNAAPGVETILLEALRDIQPDAFVPTKGSVYPMHLSLSNEAIATQGQTITTFSAGSVVDAGKGSVDETGKLYWSYILPEGGSAELDYWLKIPSDAGVIDVETSIYAGDVGFESLYATVSHTINVDSQNSYTLQDALTATEAESGGFFNFTYDSVEYHLNKAVYYENRGDYSHALSHAIEAADCLVNISKPEADEIHNKLAYAIRVLSTKL